MKTKEIYIPKREVTLMKIEMASEAIKIENKRRRKHNLKTEKDLKKGRLGQFLPIIHPAAVPTARKTRGNLGHVQGMDTLVHSNKRLCGQLSALCVALKSAELPCPWAEGV